MAPAEPLPDELRCKRTDGRDWRCKRPVMEGKLLCEIHYVQGRLRCSKKKVPESLKLYRKPGDKTKSTTPSRIPGHEGEEIRVSTGREHLDRKKKRKRVMDGGSDGDAAGVEEDGDEEKKKLKAKELLRGLVECREDTKVKTSSSTKLNKKQDKLAKVRKMVKRDRMKKKDNVGLGERGEPSDSGKEVTRDLPYGRMAISPAPVIGKDSASAIQSVGPASVKLGLNPDNYRLVTRRFRSKNIERPPISTVKVLPFSKKRKRGAAAVTAPVAGRGKKKCHWCKGANSNLFKCLSCKKFFCSDCVRERSIAEEEVKSSCPVCRGTCECRACSTSTRSKDVIPQETLKGTCKVSRHMSLHYLIHLILPVLEKINEDQTIEVETEAKSKGQSLSEVEIHQAVIDWEKQLSCHKCQSPILDLHRSCPKCSYNLCLDCCQEFRDTQELPNKRKSSVSLIKKQLNKCSTSDSGSAVQNGSMFCPSIELGGCGCKTLCLRSVFPFKWTKELEISAKQAILGLETPKMSEGSSNCSMCAIVDEKSANRNELLEASRRTLSEDNLLYCPSIHDGHDIMLLHFQKHWRKIHPVIIRDVLGNNSDLNWDPITMFSHRLEMNSGECETVQGDSKLDWYEVEYCIKNLIGWSSLRGGTQSNRGTMSLKAKLSPVITEKIFADHSAKIMDSLPLQEYTNPRTGILNIVASLAEAPKQPKVEMGPSINITCGSPEEVRKGELATSLTCNSYDTINILVDALDFSCSEDQVNRLVALAMTKNAGGSINGNSQGNMAAVEQNNVIDDEAAVHTNTVSNVLPSSEGESGASAVCSGASDGTSSEKTPYPRCDTVAVETSASLQRNSEIEKPYGIKWDVFRRQDTKKLLEYIQVHKNELSTTNSLTEVVHPIFNGNFFLNFEHKMRLREEYKIEPWTFNQRVGEAVLIPAGCAFQLTNLMSCVNVSLGFISPENAAECVKLNEKFRSLPEDHVVRQGMLEVEKLAIYKISKAVDEMNGESSTMPSP